MDLTKTEMRMVLDLLEEQNNAWLIAGHQRRLARRIARHLNVWDEYLSLVAPRAYDTMKDRAMQRLYDRIESPEPYDDWYDRLSPTSKEYIDRVGSIVRTKWAEGFRKMMRQEAD